MLRYISPTPQDASFPSQSGYRQRCERQPTPSFLRRGTALIEIVAAMSVAAVMLLMALGVLHVVLKAERSATRGIWQSTTMTRLAHSWRSDVHAAHSIEVVPAKGALGESATLTMPEGVSVTYEVVRRGISRVVHLADKREQRDLFRFSESMVCRFERLAAPDRARLLLAFPRNSAELPKSTYPPKSSGMHNRVIPIEAVVARDHRFQPKSP